MRDQWIKVGEVNLETYNGALIGPAMVGLCDYLRTTEATMADFRLVPPITEQSRIWTLLARIVPRSPAPSVQEQPVRRPQYRQFTPREEDGKGYFFPHIGDDESVAEEDYEDPKNV